MNAPASGAGLRGGGLSEFDGACLHVKQLGKASPTDDGGVEFGDVLGGQAHGEFFLDDVLGE